MKTANLYSLALLFWITTWSLGCDKVKQAIEPQQETPQESQKPQASDDSWLPAPLPPETVFLVQADLGAAKGINAVLKSWKMPEMLPSDDPALGLLSALLSPAPLLRAINAKKSAPIKGADLKGQVTVAVSTQGNELLFDALRTGAPVSVEHTKPAGLLVRYYVPVTDANAFIQSIQALCPKAPKPCPYQQVKALDSGFVQVQMRSGDKRGTGVRNFVPPDVEGSDTRFLPKDSAAILAFKASKAPLKVYMRSDRLVKFNMVKDHIESFSAFVMSSATRRDHTMTYGYYLSSLNQLFDDPAKYEVFDMMTAVTLSEKTPRIVMVNSHTEHGASVVTKALIKENHKLPKANNALQFDFDLSQVKQSTQGTKADVEVPRNAATLMSLQAPFTALAQSPLQGVSSIEGGFTQTQDGALVGRAQLKTISKPSQDTMTKLKELGFAASWNLATRDLTLISSPAPPLEYSEVPSARILTAKFEAQALSTLFAKFREMLGGLRLMLPPGLKSLGFAVQVEPAYTLTWIDLGGSGDAPNIPEVKGSAPQKVQGVDKTLHGIARLDIHESSPVEALKQVSDLVKKLQANTSNSVSLKRAKKAWLLRQAQLSAHLLDLDLASSAMEKACQITLPEDGKDACKSKDAFMKVRFELTSQEGAKTPYPLILAKDQLQQWGPYPLVPPKKLVRHPEMVIGPAMYQDNKKDDINVRYFLQEPEPPMPLLVARSEPLSSLDRFLARANFGDRPPQAPSALKERMSVQLPLPGDSPLVMYAIQKGEVPLFRAELGPDGINLTRPQLGKHVTTKECKGRSTICFSDAAKKAYGTLTRLTRDGVKTKKDEQAFEAALKVVLGDLSPERLAQAAAKSGGVSVLSLKSKESLPWGLAGPVLAKLKRAFEAQGGEVNLFSEQP